MSYEVVLSAIPAQITAGDSVSWTYTNSDFPASTWTLTYTLVNSSVQIQIVASADSDDHLVELAAATTAAYTAGNYDWQAHVTDGTERYQVAAGIIEIVTNFPTQSSGYDARSHAKTVLDALEAVIEGRATKSQMEQKIGEVMVKHMDFEQLVKMRDKYAAKYQNELIRAGKAKSHKQIKARFTL